jgi:hypothetical protein
LYQKKGIQDKNVHTGKLLQASIATFVNNGIFHPMLPTGDNQDLQLLK